MRSRHSFLLAALLVLGAARPAAASTLDPSHPVWSRTGFDQDRWLAALRALASDRAEAPKWHVPPAARGRIASVGRRVLVIPVLPTDSPAPPRTRDDLDRAWNADDEGSVRGFWKFVSAGELELECLVLPWLSVPGSLASDYPNVVGGNPGNLTAGPQQLARDALAAAARVVDDLHVFDDDGPDGVAGSGDDDGVLDLVVVLHPFVGWETDPVAVDRAIVSLQSRLGKETIEGTPLRADAFVVASARGPLGVWVHEFGHLLGLPDLYDLDRSPVNGTPGGPGPQGGLGRWSLMASGTWGDDGARPSGLDAWSRRSLGFGDEVDLEVTGVEGLPWVDATIATSLRLHPLGDWGEEAFLVEARRPRPAAVVDGALPGTGALVYRVRPDLPSNTIAAKFVELLQADGRTDLDDGTNDGDGTDPYDGSTGRDRLDRTTNPSSESAFADPSRTPPALGFVSRSAGMELSYDLSLGATLRLERLGMADSFLGTRAWLRPGETGTLVLAFADAGAVPVSGARVTLDVDAGGRALGIVPPGPVELVEEDGLLVPATAIEVTDLGNPGTQGEARLGLQLEIDGSTPRALDVGLPVRFAAGLPADALARFTQVVAAAPTDTTRFARLDVGSLPQPAFVGHELRTAGSPGYADGVELSLVSPWFGVPEERLAWIWTRGRTEEGLPGQVFDGAAVEVLYPDRGWRPLVPEGPVPVWISRRSGAATRDRLGFGGDQPQWEASSLPLPRTDLPARIRVRFASDGTVSTGFWQVAGLQTAAYPRAEITIDADRSDQVIALARLSGDFSRVNLASYRYRLDAFDVWKPASGNFSIISSETFSVVLTLLPDEVTRAEIGLFSDSGAGSFLLGSAGFRRLAAPAMPALLSNPARGRLVLQSPDLAAPLDLGIYDVRGRRRASLTIPAHTTWLEWEPRNDAGHLLSSGQYFLFAVGTDLAAVRFTWFR